MPTRTRSQRREEERKKEKRRKALGVAFAILLSVAAEVPQVPLIPWGVFLLMASVVLLIILFWHSEFTEHISVEEKVAGCWCIASWVFIFAWILLGPKWIAEKASAPEGDLDLPNWHAPIAVAQIGDARNRLIIGNKHPLPIINMFRDAGLTFDYDNGRILLTTFVRDQQGKWIVHIEKNHWTVNADRSICMDKNYTRDSLEVLDGRGHVVLQVRLYPDRVSVQGIWFNDKGVGVEIVATPDGGWSDVILRPPRGTEDEILIPTLFKYPSSKHWAEWK